jgi:hypothetical protein
VDPLTSLTDDQFINTEAAVKRPVSAATPLRPTEWAVMALKG